MGDVFARAGWARPAPADDDRIGGWMLMYQLLDSGEWVIGDNCTALIRCLPTLVRDDLKVEDIAKVDGDDAADAARYGLKSRVAPKRKPLEVASMNVSLGCRLLDLRVACLHKSTRRLSQ